MKSQASHSRVLAAGLVALGLGVVSSAAGQAPLDPYGDAEKEEGDEGGEAPLDPYGDAEKEKGDEGGEAPLDPYGDAEKEEGDEGGEAPLDPYAGGDRSRDRDRDRDRSRDRSRGWERGDPEILRELERRGPPAPAEVDEAVAEALLERARVLFEEGESEGAKTLAVESIERDPRGPHAAEALGLLRTINRRLGFRDDHGLSPSRKPPDESRAPVEGPVVKPGDDLTSSRDRLGLASWAGLYGMTTGLALGGPQSDQGELSSAAMVSGLVGAGGAAGLSYYLSGRYALTPGQSGAIASAGTWGAMTGGLLGHVVTGIASSTPNEITAYTAAGGLVGTGAGTLYAVKRPPSPGAVHLSSSLSAYGTAAALFLGMAMEPPTREAYSLNAAIGGAAGLGAGLWIAERYGAPSSARMLRIDLGAGVAAAGTWLLVYPATGSARITGAVSAVSVAAGALGAMVLTRGGDAPEEGGVEDAARREAPPALIVREPSGAWAAGLPVPRPLAGRALDPGREASLGLDLVSGRF